MGSIFVHLALESQHPEIRRSVNTSIINAAVRSPKTTSHVVREALTAFVARGPPSQKATNDPSDEVETPWNKQARLAALLLSAVSCGEGVDAAVRETIVVELIVLAHHQLICPYVNLFIKEYRVQTSSQVVLIDIHGLTYVRKPKLTLGRSLRSILIG